MTATVREQQTGPDGRVWRLTHNDGSVEVRVGTAGWRYEGPHARWWLRKVKGDIARHGRVASLEVLLGHGGRIHGYDEDVPSADELVRQLSDVEVPERPEMPPLPDWARAPEGVGTEHDVIWEVDLPEGGNLEDVLFASVPRFDRDDTTVRIVAGVLGAALLAVVIAAAIVM